MIVSFSLMVAMAIMVHSFRVSFVDWLGRSLPADLQLRLGGDSDTAALDEPSQARLAAIDGVELRTSFDAPRDDVWRGRSH